MNDIKIVTFVEHILHQLSASTHHGADGRAIPTVSTQTNVRALVWRGEGPALMTNQSHTETTTATRWTSLKKLPCPVTPNQRVKLITVVSYNWYFLFADSPERSSFQSSHYLFRLHDKIRCAVPSRINLREWLLHKHAVGQKHELLLVQVRFLWRKVLCWMI